MKRSRFDETRDQRIADDTGKPQHLMCSAHGCPNLWSTSDGQLCRWHADAEPHRWPEVTAEMQWHDTERARLSNVLEQKPKPLTFEDKKAILAKLAALPAKWAKQDPKAWAYRLRDRETSGERLSEKQRVMWRAAIGSQSGVAA